MSYSLFIAEVTPTNVMLFGFAILGVFFLLFAAFWFAWRFSHRSPCLSPYSGIPLRKCSDLSYYNAERVLRYIYDLQDYENRLFVLRTSSFCRETGRIFQKSVTWFDTISVDWDFIQKRYPGHFVSWGSLSEEQQIAIRDMHESMEGFQTERSSKEPSPRAVEPQYALMKPGPLYVDIDSHVLVGWKCVPNTSLEVLIVKRPRPKAEYRHLDSY